MLAAALAGGAGAVLYGAREVALIGTGIGAAVGVALLILMPGQATLTDAVVVASILAATVGLTFSFPRRCTRHVPGKLLAGLVTGGWAAPRWPLPNPCIRLPFRLSPSWSFWPVCTASSMSEPCVPGSPCHAASDWNRVPAT
ncbi:MAG: hypothetical protein MZV65_26735 [Chromatiales bacterium]|nr:hypothetical protein [Chromatiales bacterium]